MNEIKTFCMMACAVSLLSVMIRAVAPERMQQQVGMAANLFLMLCLLSPLAEISIPNTFSPEVGRTAPPAGLDTDSLLTREIQSRLEAAVGEKLAQNGIFPDEIRIDITVAENMVAIHSASVLLRTEDGQLRSETQALTEELLQTGVLVTAGEEVQ